VENREILQTIAEVAAAFAGFTGVISVFGRLGDSDDGWSLQGARSIIESSLATILFALVPFVVSGFGAGSPAVWRVSSGLFLALVLAGALGGARRIWQVAGSGDTSAVRMSPLFLGVSAVIGLGMFALLAANVLGFSFGSPATVYLLCLMGPLAVAGLTFLQMVVRASAP